MKRYHRMTDADRAEIWDLHGKGFIPMQIAKKTGRSFSTVAALIKSNGGIRPARPTASTGRSLTLEEREEISRGLRAAETFTVIAERLGRSPSTISREVGRNGGRDGYRATTADRDTRARARRPKRFRLDDGTQLGELVRSKLLELWSPEQIAGWLRVEHPNDASIWVSHETIYRAIYTQTAGMTPGHAACLRSGRTIRRPPRRRCHGKDRRGHNPNMVLISERPQAANDRSEPGHWEGDLVFGSGHRRALATLVERVSRFTILLDYSDGFSADVVAADLTRVFKQLPAELCRSLTWDQGSELAAHLEFTARSGIPVYFCNPRSPWQRPTNENTNGLLRQFFPRGVSLAGVTTQDIDRAARMLNNRPRHVLNWQNPAARLAQLCAPTM